MATDYLDRMYWPIRSRHIQNENFTTYGRTIAMSAKLSAVDRKNGAAEMYKDRHDAFIDMVARQSGSLNGIPGSGGSRSARLQESYQPSHRRSKTFMSRTYNITTTPLDVALYHGPINDPFVPNNSYKEYVLRRSQQHQSQLPYLGNDDEYDGGMAVPGAVHRLYRSAGGYDDTVKASNHIKYYRPEVADMSEYKVRQGRNGGVWRHVKEVMQGKGERIMFVDGMTSIDDLARVKTQIIQGGIRTPLSKPSSTKNFTTYVTPEETRASEGVNWQVLR